jgi:hypothetical protein
MSTGLGPGTGHSQKNRNVYFFRNLRHLTGDFIEVESKKYYVKTVTY